METKSDHSLRIPLGISSLMVVFLVLCLAVFAVLSLSGARGDLHLSQKDAQYTRDYYAASSRATRILDALDERLARGEEIASCTIDGIPVQVEGNSIRYQLPIDDKQLLDVEIVPCEPETEGVYYTIRSWRVLRQGGWESGSNLPPLGKENA